MSIESRYDRNSIILNQNKKRVFTTVMYPTIERDPADLYILTHEMDRLDLLAHRYYNDSRYWWIIAQANFLGKGSFFVEPGIRLRIPKNIDKIIADFESLNANR